MGSKVNILQHFYLKVTKPIFHQIPSNSGNSENGDVSEVSEPLGESCLQHKQGGGTES